MSSPPTAIDHFKGTDWEECTKFILAVRAAAWKEGKLWDLAWMAGLASLHMTDRALFWHAQLPLDVCQDWRKLEVALLDRWAPKIYGDEPRIEPTPAAAPSVNRIVTTGAPLQGVLKVVSETSGVAYYVTSSNGGSNCAMTSDSKQALRVRCNSLSGTTLLELIDGSQHSWLGIHWQSLDPNLENGSKDYCYLVTVDSYSLKGSWSNSSNPWQLLTCTIATNGEVIPVWRRDAVGTKNITLGACSSTYGVVLAPDPRKVLDLRLKSWETAKIFFEPIDS